MRRQRNPLGKPVLITKARGQFIESSAGLLTFITIHPSAIYRQREKDQQEKEYRRFAEELKLVSRKLRSLTRNAPNRVHVNLDSGSPCQNVDRTLSGMTVN